jgi:hypothetical protein
MADDIRMVDWWDGLSESEQRQWCRAGANDHITSTMSDTVPVEHYDSGPNEWLTAHGTDANGAAHWHLATGFKEFLTRQCHPE